MSIGWRCCPSTKWEPSSGRRSGSTTSSPTRQPRLMRRCRLRSRFSAAPAVGRAEAGSVAMIASVSDLIGTQPILALFLAIGLGYAVGQVNVLGFSLGVGAVLFVGL